jgi:ribosomal protein L7/L12
VETLEPSALTAPSPDPSAPSSHRAPADLDLGEVRAALRAGKQIDAIRRYRELSGCSLREAKAVVDDLARDPMPAPTPESPAPGPNLGPVFGLLAEGLRQAAVERYGEIVGCGFDQARAAVARLAPPPGMERVRAELAAGHRKVAARLYREAHGVSLVQAKRDLAELYPKLARAPAADQANTEPAPDLSEVHDALEGERQAEAIERYAQLMGCDPEEAEAAVARLVPAPTLDEILAELQAGQRKAAARLYQERHGGSMNQARRAVGALAHEHGLTPAPPPKPACTFHGCGGFADDERGLCSHHLALLDRSRQDATAGHSLWGEWGLCLVFSLTLAGAATAIALDAGGVLTALRTLLPD